MAFLKGYFASKSSVAIDKTTSSASDLPQKQPHTRTLESLSFATLPKGSAGFDWFGNDHE